MMWLVENLSGSAACRIPLTFWIVQSIDWDGLRNWAWEKRHVRTRKMRLNRREQVCASRQEKIGQVRKTSIRAGWLGLKS